ncbi:MAG: response regulator transcription factor [Burkholderiaceae bacterium]
MALIRTTVVLVEDNPLHARRFRDNMAADDSLQLLREFSSGAHAIAELAALQPDVALVDLNLPDLSGFEVIRHIRAAAPQTAVMVVSVFGGERNLVEAIEAGATGYLLKDSNAYDFNRSIHALCAGESPISPSLARHLLARLQPPRSAQPAAPSPLSPRETEVLEMIVSGQSLAEIGAAMHISPLTVKSHVQNIYRKLEARSRQQAIHRARQRGLLTP